MGKPVCRLGDPSTGESCWPGKVNIAGSPDVITENLPTHRQTDAWEVHCCGPSCHDSILAAGDPTVFVNNLQVGRVGDPIDCGDAVAAGAATVFANANPGGGVVHIQAGDSAAFDAVVILPPPNDSLPPSDMADPYEGVDMSDPAAVAAADIQAANNYVKQAAMVSTPVSFADNIQPALSQSDVPTKYPTAAEQIDTKSDGSVPDFIPIAATVCGTESQKNPFDVARQMMDLGVWAENGSNPNITQLWDEIGYNGANFSDQTAWCAVFVGAVLKRSSNLFIKTASSQAYKNYGVEVPIEDIRIGDIVVFFRKGKNSGYGHVGFYAGSRTKTTLAIIGGNQGNNLNVRNFKISKPSKGWGLRSIRRAISCVDSTTEAPDTGLEGIAATGEGGRVV